MKTKKNNEQLDMFMASIDNEAEKTSKKEFVKTLEKGIEILKDNSAKTINEDLSIRQNLVWRLISHNSLVENRKTTQREIYEKVAGFDWNEEPTAHDHCPAIWNDIKDINESPNTNKIIISKNFEYWIGSKRETEAYLAFLWGAISPRLKRYWNIVRKVKLDGTGKMFDENNDSIDAQSYFLQFYDMFNKYDVEMQNHVEEGDKNANE